MKTRSSLMIAGLCGLLVSNASSEDASSTSASPAAKPAEAQAQSNASSSPPLPVSAPTRPEADKETPAAGKPDPSAKLSPSLVAWRANEEANRAHIRPARGPFPMETPPPPPREEKKPSAPAEGYVWMPGHWKPVNGKWQWKAGEWGVPATPSSVWIEGKYDSKDKQWSEGYWQPDRPDSYEGDSFPKDAASPAK